MPIQPIQARVFNSQNDPRGQFCANGNYTGTGSNGAALADWKPDVAIYPFGAPSLKLVALAG